MGGARRRRFLFDPSTSREGEGEMENTPCIDAAFVPRIHVGAWCITMDYGGSRKRTLPSLYAKRPPCTRQQQNKLLLPPSSPSETGKTRTNAMLAITTPLPYPYTTPHAALQLHVVVQQSYLVARCKRWQSNIRAPITAKCISEGAIATAAHLALDREVNFGEVLLVEL